MKSNYRWYSQNAVERAITIFKDHFLEGLESVNPPFPPHLWDCLIEQAEITVNFLRMLKINPSLSAYIYIGGNYNFNAHPMAPPGTAVILHKKLWE